MHGYHLKSVTIYFDLEISTFKFAVKLTLLHKEGTTYQLHYHTLRFGKINNKKNSM